MGAGRHMTPLHQILTPAGLQVELPGQRPQVLALSPNGRILAVAGKGASLAIIDPVSGAIRQRVALPSEDAEPAMEPVSTHQLRPDLNGHISYTGLAFSPDGRRLYLSNVKGSVKVFEVSATDQVAPLHSIALPLLLTGKRRQDIPAGLAVSPDGRRLYVALNLANRLVELDLQTGTALRQWDVGLAPYDVVLNGSTAYVSNWGGRRPGSNDLTGPVGAGARVRVDPVRHIASEGSLSIVDLAQGGAVEEIVLGSHTSALALSPDRRHLVAANTDSDTLSVLDTRTRAVVETVWTRQSPADLFGASPNTMAFDSSGRRLFVCNGTQNAVAVIEFRPGASKLLGLVPAGWYPAALAYDARRDTLHIANLKGTGDTFRVTPQKGTNASPAFAQAFNSRQHHGSLSITPVPGAKDLQRLTQLALLNLRYPLLAAARLPARPDQPARPVPERAGEPSLIRHVIYIIKENRTYDQVFGDMPQGNGAPGLCVFGERVSPNHHQIARQFVLLDNAYCSGVLSADGHQWADSAFANDYLERSFAGFPRSYPDGMDDTDVDALAYSPSGFIWDLALAHKRSLRVYGEFAITDKAWAQPSRRGAIHWKDHYNDFLTGAGAVRVSSRPAIESLRGRICTNTVGWDMDIPDVWRAARFIDELRQCERAGTFPQLTLVCLPNDHTSGLKAGSPTPAAQVADNDLALGQILEAVSRSPFWKDTCVLVMEDDPQDGWDHVSGFRTVAMVASPYTRRGQVVSTRYNQASMLRTIELMLGLPPMNQMDATATPLADCFTATPDFTPYTALTNNIPLDQMNPVVAAHRDPLMRRLARASARLPLDKPDQCSEDLLNRILWHAQKGSQAPYPAWAVRSTGDDDD